MLGLGQEVGGHVARVGGVVGQDHDLARARLVVDLHLPADLPLGGGHVRVAGTHDLADRLDLPGAVGEGGDGLRPAHPVDAPFEADRDEGGGHRGIGFEGPGRRGDTIRGTPATRAGMAFMSTDEG